MSKLRNASTLIFSGVLALILVGCAATGLNPGAERIIVSKKDAPKGCKFRASVVGEQGGSFLGKFTSNKNLTLGALNDIKNKAQIAGANYVQLETTAQGNTWSHGKSGGGGGQTDVTQTGNAYFCPPKLIGLE